jgi:hypothetical protein
MTIIGRLDVLGILVFALLVIGMRFLEGDLIAFLCGNLEYVIPTVVSLLVFFSLPTPWGRRGG